MQKDSQPVTIERRTVAKGMAWAVPAVAVAQATPAFAASRLPASLKLVNTVTLADYHGISCSGSLGGSERYWGRNEFRYRVRFTNNGEGGAITELITVSIPLDLRKDHVNGERNADSWGSLTPQEGVVQPLVQIGGVESETLGSWSTSHTKNNDNNAGVVTMTFDPPAGGLKPGDWAQASLVFHIADWLRGNNELNPGSDCDEPAEAYHTYLRNERWFWRGRITVSTKNIEKREDFTDGGTTDLGLWYFDGGCGRDYGVPGDDNSSNLTPHSCAFKTADQYSRFRGGTGAYGAPCMSRQC